MKPELESPEHSPVAGSLAIKVTIIYEDFTSGTRARNFAERLAQQLDGHGQLSESIWRSELLECPPLAEAAARDAAQCNYLIVALRGDRVLPFATRQWVEEQLDDAAMRGAALIVLPASDQGKWRVVEATRHHFRSLCAMKGVPFFSCSNMAPADDAESDTRHREEAADSLLRWMPGWSASENQNERRHDLALQH